MINHTFASVKTGVSIGQGSYKSDNTCKQYLLRDNYLSEYKTQEDKQKVLNNLGIQFTLEWIDVN